MTDVEENARDLLARLREDLIGRQVRAGMGRLDAHAACFESLDPCVANGPQLLWRLALWVDIGWRDTQIVKAALARVPQGSRGCFVLRDYAVVRMAEGMVAMSMEDVDEAVGHFNAVLLLADDIDDSEIVAIANFWKARCQRKRGEYDSALAHAIAARTTALECGCPRMAAVMRTLESWLLFQKGRHKESIKVLSEAESLLCETDDFVVLGNIQSTYGRIYRQEGRYERAIEHFNRAIDQYRNADRHHPNLARTLSNMAYVERVVALEMRRRIEEDLARKKHGRLASDSEASHARHREEFARVRDLAFAHLDEAAAIYNIHPNYRGSGTVHLNRGLLHLDNGALDLAEEQASEAFSLGEEKEDLILMSRARLLQCMVENGKVEEGIDDDPRQHAQSALEYIREAIEFAHRTQNRRLLARVHTWHGLTLANEFFHAHDAAIEALNTANSYLDHGFHDTAWQDLRLLKSRVVRTQTVDETLLAWSQGAVGDRTFREISEQFAEIIIPRVWEIEGRKIARVAARLSVSPKKVRRALNRAGLLRSESAAAGE